MTTREENLKKINDELEKLSDEQLEQVAGGTRDESTEISKLIGYVEKPNGDYSPLPEGGGIMDDYLKEHFGIDAKTHHGNTWSGYQGEANSYSYNGKPISHAEAMEIIRKKLGR